MENRYEHDRQVILGLLEEIADSLVDLPERLAEVLDVRGAFDVAPLDSSALVGLAPPLPPPFDFGPEGAGPLPAPHAAAGESEPTAPTIAAPVTLWPEEAASPLLAPGAIEEPLVPPTALRAPSPAWTEEPAPAVAPPGAIEDLFEGIASPAEIRAGAGDFEDKDTALGGPDTAAELEPAQLVGGPAAERPGEGGGELARMVTLLERIAGAVEALGQKGSAGGPIPDRDEPKGYGSRMAAWTAQHARDFDAEENFPTASPSVNVSSVGGLAGASSEDRGYGSGYRKTALARAKVFDEPGGHG